MAITNTWPTLNFLDFSPESRIEVEQGTWVWGQDENLVKLRTTEGVNMVFEGWEWPQPDPFSHRSIIHDIDEGLIRQARSILKDPNFSSK